MAGGVGVFRHAPNTLDAVVFGDELFNHIHVWAIVIDRDIDHLNAKVLADREVSIVAGHGTKKFDCRRDCPPFRKSVFDVLVHQCQAAVAAHHNLCRGYTQQVCTKCSGLGYAEDAAVVPDIAAVLEQVEATQNAVEVVGQVQLLGRRFASRQIKF